MKRTEFELKKIYHNYCEEFITNSDNEGNSDLTRSSSNDFWSLDYRQFEFNGCISAAVSEETGFVRDVRFERASLAQCCSQAKLCFVKKV